MVAQADRLLVAAPFFVKLCLVWLAMEAFNASPVLFCPSLLPVSPSFVGGIIVAPFERRCGGVNHSNHLQTPITPPPSHCFHLASSFSELSLDTLQKRLGPVLLWSLRSLPRSFSSESQHDIGK